MAESVVDVDGNGSFQSQPEDLATGSRSSRRTSETASSVWKELRKRKPRGNPRAAYEKRVANVKKSAKLQEASDRFH